MAKDTVVGVIGAILIVGSMTGVIQALETEDETTPSDIGGPPPSPGKSRIVTDGCQALTLTWTPAISDLEPIVGPHWTPAPGPVQGRGLFALFAFECPKTTVDGLRRGSSSGAAALIPIETPDDTRNVSADAWVATPELITAGTSPVTRAYETHAFPLTPGSGSVGVQATPVGSQVRMVIETGAGQLEATATVGGQASMEEGDVAIVGTSEDTFSVMAGPEGLSRQTTGSAIVQTSGTTWVERLNLEPTPFEVRYDTEFWWDFTLWHEPWSATNSTEQTVLAR